MAQKGYPITTLTPGVDLDVTLILLKQLAPEFDQIVLSGYPLVIKELLELGEKQGFDWKKYRVRLTFGSEGFSETFRDELHKKAGIKDPLTGSSNTYGSADATIHSIETPLTIAIRRAIGEGPKDIEAVFGDTRMPTLTQYDPLSKFFEVLTDKSLILTARTGIPLIRYSIGDWGNVCSYEDMVKRFALIGHAMDKVLDQKHKQYLWKLPFVYLFGRNDFTVNLSGLNVYPEYVKYALERIDLSADVTGRFMMSVEQTPEQNPYLLLRIELAASKKADAQLTQKLQQIVIDGLKEISYEYLKYHRTIYNEGIPEIELIEYGDERYFKRGTKQRWTKK